MFGLLRETWLELASRFLQFIHCFWFGAVLWIAAAISYGLGYLAPFEGLAALAAAIFLGISPGLVRWHRHVIASEATTWVPALPSALSIAYFVKLVLAFVAWGCINRIVASAVSDLAIPVLYAFGIEIDPEHYDFVVDLVVGILSIVAYVVLVGGWLLHLPEGALDPASRGARKSWPPNGRKNFLRALMILYLVPFLAADLVVYFVQSWDAAAILSLIAAVLFAALGVNLLTVAYRLNLDQLGMSFGRKVPVR